jgi:hypothetical protein
MEHFKKKGVFEKKLSTIVKAESLELTMRHRNLIKAERLKDGKSFVLFKVDSALLIPRIDQLIKLNVFNGVKRVFGCAENTYAELSASDEEITLSCILEVDIELNEGQIAALLSKIVSCKNNLLTSSLSDIHLKPELVFLDQNGKMRITAIDAKKEENIFNDIVSVFRSLLQRRTASMKEDCILSKTLLDLITLIDKLSKLSHTGPLSTLHPRHWEIWEKIVKHSFIKQKFQRQSLEEVYTMALAKLNHSNQVGKLPFQALQNESITIDRICWKPEDHLQTLVDYSAVGRMETSDSSGGSSNSHVVGQTTIDNPANGSQEWKAQRDKLKSAIFQESCKTVIESMIAKTKKESSSNFLVSALDNLLQTLISCEEIHPNKTESILNELIQLKN